MRYYTEVELPQYVPIAEAAHWLAFGILPEASYTLSGGDRPIEVRENIDEILDKGGHALEYDLYFGEAYLLRFFQSIDAKLYLADYETCYGKNPEQVEHEIESWKKREESIYTVAGVSSIVKGLQEELLAAKRLRQLQRPIMHKLETSRAKVFLELANGQMKSKGLEMPPLDSRELIESDDYEFPKEFSDIPSDLWSFNCIDWDTSNLNLWDKSYNGVIVAMTDLFSIFPNPDIAAQSVAGRLFGTTFIPEHDSDGPPESESVPRRIGAPQRTETVLEKAIHAHLSVLHSTGVLATKNEAQIAEISDFVQQNLGQVLPRSTAQRIHKRWLSRNAQKDAQK